MGTRQAITGFGLGLGLMYVFDPALGRRRRARAIQKFVGVLDDMNGALELGLRDAGSRARGLAGKALSRLPGMDAVGHKLEGALGAKAGSMLGADWTPGTRLAAGSLGAYLMGRCAANPTFFNLLLGTAGFGLFAKSVSNASLAADLSRRERLNEPAHDDAAKGMEEAAAAH